MGNAGACIDADYFFSWERLRWCRQFLLLSEYYSNYDVSMPVVILFLLITPFAFVAALMFAFGVHKIAQGNGADKNIILGFAMMLLLAVDNLIYIPIHYRGDNGDPLSFMILGAIELICLIIFFLYYQNWGNKALTFCAGILLVLSFGFEMVEAIRLFLCAADITLTLDTFYNLMKKSAEHTVSGSGTSVCLCIEPIGSR